ncbi:MAG TPA: hypothetical protein VE242_09570, partial [Chthoniobacterales bacterium]|nr:hypothetical protein [Chthoniobacterales bacterium]
ACFPHKSCRTANDLPTLWIDAILRDCFYFTLRICVLMDNPNTSSSPVPWGLRRPSNTIADSMKGQIARFRIHSNPVSDQRSDLPLTKRAANQGGRLWREPRRTLRRAYS